MEVRFRTSCLGMPHLGVDGDSVGLFGGDGNGLASFRALPSSWAGFGMRVFFGDVFSGTVSEDEKNGSSAAPGCATGSV